MKITSITAQKRDKNRVNISVDGRYRLSLNINQLITLGVKVGGEYDEDNITLLEQESQYGKLYSRALEYCLMRPHSSKEVQSYLFRKTTPKTAKTGERRPGISSEITNKVHDRLVEKGYIDDIKFARYWVENRSLLKGISVRKLTSELRSKGIDDSIINKVVQETCRTDSDEIKKIILKKRRRYPDDQKLKLYLSRQGFGYDEIKKSLNNSD